MVLDANTLIAASGAIIVPVTALLLNYRGFASIDSRFASLEANLAGRFGSMERRLERLEADLKDFYKTQADNERDIARLKDHTGLK